MKNDARHRKYVARARRYGWCSVTHASSRCSRRLHLDSIWVDQRWPREVDQSWPRPEKRIGGVADVQYWQGRRR
eukprot:3901419-Prymnesium_polylepis.1